MAYNQNALNGYLLLQDQQGTQDDDVEAPPEGQTSIYTTEQGIVAERASTQWFLDPPHFFQGTATLGGNTSWVEASGESLPYTFPDDIDADFPTIYRVDVSVQVGDFVPDGSSANIIVNCYVDGQTGGNDQYVPCSAATGNGGATCTFWVTVFGSGWEIVPVARLIDGDDAASVSLIGTIRRDFRYFGGG